MHQLPSVVLESGLAGSPLVWSAVAKLLEPECCVVIHARNSRRTKLPEIAQDLHAALHKAAIPPPYLLVGHSFGALVIRQFAATYPAQTAALLFVDALPLTTHIAPQTMLPALTAIRIAQALASVHLIGPVLPILQHALRPVNWAFQELRKLPPAHQRTIQAEWSTPGFYRDLARTLAALPTNLRIACALPKPPLTHSLHSDYPDPSGQRIENAGHWIQIDRPEAVANAVRTLARVIIEQKGA